MQTFEGRICMDHSLEVLEYHEGGLDCPRCMAEISSNESVGLDFAMIQGACLLSETLRLRANDLKLHSISFIISRISLVETVVDYL